MHKLIIILMSLFIYQTSSATNLNLILNDDDSYEMGSSEAVINGDKLIFNGYVNDIYSVWSFDINTLQKTPLVDGQALTNYDDKAFIKKNNNHYFIARSNTDYKSRLWKTDGTLTGTVLVSDMPLFSALNQNNGYLYAMTQSLKTAVFDESEVIVHELYPQNLNSVCIYEPNNIIVQTSATDNKRFKHSNNGVIRTLDINKYPPVEVALPQIFYHNGWCVAAGDGDDNGSQSENLWKIDEAGELTSLNDVIGNELTLKLISHQNSVYAITGSIQTSYIQKLNSELNGIESIFGDPLNSNLNVTNMKSFGNLIAIRRDTPTISPSRSFVVFADTDLTQVSDSLFFPVAEFPEYYQSQNDEFLTINHIFETDTSLLINPFDSIQKSLILPQSRFNSSIISDIDSDAVFLKSSQSNGLTKLYQLLDVPNVDQIMTGGWHDPEIHNQGLNIRAGTRANGSHYINLTGYTFQNGEPFWFAGVADYTYPQAALDIEVFEFSGINTFEPNNTPNRASYGNINLKMLDCNQLRAEVVTSSETYELTLVRLDDVTFSSNCVD